MFPCHVLLRDTSDLRELEDLLVCVTASCGWAVLAVHAPCPAVVVELSASLSLSLFPIHSFSC